MQSKAKLESMQINNQTYSGGNNNSKRFRLHLNLLVNQNKLEKVSNSI